MEAGNRRKFSREFKVEAVRMANEGTRSSTEVARDLGIHVNLLGDPGPATASFGDDQYQRRIIPA